MEVAERVLAASAEPGVTAEAGPLVSVGPPARAGAAAEVASYQKNRNRNASTSVNNQRRWRRLTGATFILINYYSILNNSYYFLINSD